MIKIGYMWIALLVPSPSSLFNIASIFLSILFIPNSRPSSMISSLANTVDPGNTNAKAITIATITFENFCFFLFLFDIFLPPNYYFSRLVYFTIQSILFFFFKFTIILLQRIGITIQVLFLQHSLQ